MNIVNDNAAGLFISLEGGEGSGKTTQINRLAQLLTEKGRRVITTREPGGTKESESIRSLLVQRDGGNWTPMAETLLLFAARVMHIEKVIKPALSEGAIVISDRFTDSTRAYQGYGGGVSLEDINQIDKISIDSFSPDITFILDIDAKEGLSRSNKRLSSELGYEQTEDRFERKNINFHEKLRKGFLDIAANNPSCCHVLDASASIEIISEKLQEIILKKISG